MKIAHIVPVMTTVPPQKYGGIEAVVEQLAKGQAAAGHEVTIFAAKGSKPPATGVKIIEAAPYPTTKKLSENRKWEIHELLQAVSMQDNFDVLNFHYEPIIAQVMVDNIENNLLNFIHKPAVVTFHNTTHIKANIQYYRSHKELWNHNFVFISNNHRKPLRFLPHTHVIYNGILVESYPFNEHPKDYLLFMGRITKVKGTVEAIQCAKKAKKKLIIAAKVDPVDREYYEKKVKPLIDGRQIVYVGEVDFKQKVGWYKNALCTIFPISWEEPFGLVMTESLACGTPVIGFNRGSVPEIIEDGKTGFVVKNIVGMVRAISNIHKIKRIACRQRIEQYFSSEKMVDNYLKLYRQVIKPKL